MIRRIVLAGIWVSDQDVALKFYVENLGFELQTDITMETGYRWIEVVPPGGDTALTLAKPYFGQKDVSVGGFTNVVLSCDNIIKTCEELESRGVKFIEKPNIQDWGMMQALFEDPDGNVFVLVERED
ncbi:MAG: VOC family protein [Methanobacterium sp.]|uniref:VOC family protein n=1 Tax=Methanobacterium sp. TaxID=2164 RepID=UPI003C7601F2